MAASKEVTQLLIAWRNGDQSALDKLLPIVYRELRRLAANLGRRHRRSIAVWRRVRRLRSVQLWRQVHDAEQRGIRRIDD